MGVGNAKWPALTTIAGGAAALGWGCLAASPLLGGSGAIAVGFGLWGLTRKPRSGPFRPVGASRPAEPQAGEPSDPESLVRLLLGQGRFALLLRRQLAENLSKEQFERACEALEENMALVPDGEVTLIRTLEFPSDSLGEDGDPVPQSRRVVRVRHFFLDRYPVTNAQYREFVVAGGYEQASLWDPTILPAVLDFVDQTGHPGPAFWKHGCYEPGEEDHPVVGVNWYEACAYARWAGKRLPTDAEWVKAASWPVTLPDGSRVQRRYPWGDSMEPRRANIWGQGPGRIVSVDQFASGVSVGGVYQLIGNVWEWTWSDYRPFDTEEGEIQLPCPMKSIRGGAFDTYFDSQATCQFQSGDRPTARKHNIGFRCALGVADIVLSFPGDAEQTEDDDTDVEAEVDIADEATQEIPA